MKTKNLYVRVAGHPANIAIQTIPAETDNYGMMKIAAELLNDSRSQYRIKQYGCTHVDVFYWAGTKSFDVAKNVAIKDLKTGVVIDETGCRRYTMTLDELQTLYKRFENFVADCTQEEYEENKAAIIAVYSLIHKHMNAEVFK